MHAKDLLHRDLKPANIFIGYQACIGDFGTICLWSDLEKRRKLCTTCWWISPELAIDILEKKSLRRNTNQLLDIWSLGCILYDFMYCPENSSTCLPWINSSDAETTFKTLKSLADTFIQWMLEPTDKKCLRHLIWKMLQLKPADRISSMDEVSKEFNTCTEVLQLS